MSKNIDLLIIKPGSSKKIYGDLSASFAAIEPPVWGGMIAGFIRNKGYSVEILDMEVEGLTVEQITDEIIKSNPLLINIVVMGPNPSASSTPLMSVTRELLNSLKKKSADIKTILTGIHPSALPERTLREEKTDFV
jgi:anaerobic magnesium-protoporphyrin IX monomethyl ester cyclase